MSNGIRRSTNQGFQMKTPATSSDAVFPIDFPRLWAAVESQFRGNFLGIHAKPHWQQVERNGIALAKANGLSDDELVVVRLFSILHDSQRTSDGGDHGHGQLAAAYAQRQQGTHFTLPMALLNKLADACARHEFGQITSDLLIGTCWDADRLDLVRIGVIPREELMNTPEGKRLARASTTRK
jgi:uncharacterized protein